MKLIEISRNNHVSAYRMFVYTIVENLGLCVELTADLQAFLDVVFWLQIVLCIVGAVGSTIAAVVCVGRKLRSSSCVLLACVALYDVFFLLSSLVLAALALVDSWDSSATKVFLALRNLTLWGATYTTVDICAERCVSIAFPFLAHSRLTVGFALKRSCVILVLGVLFTVPYVVDLINGYSVGDGCLGDRNLTTFGLVFTLYISLLLLYLLPFVAIIVINVVFAVILCRLRLRSVRPKGENTTAEQQLSALVLGLSGWYAVSMLVPSVIFLIRLTQIELFDPDTDIRVAAAADTVVILSCCSNFLFYFLLWRPFRHLVCVWIREKTGSLRSSSYTTTDSSNSDRRHHCVSHHTHREVLELESSH
ncbi:probable G-protein coupled receptor B0563.6 [Littorina saxatilis]|uniref:probable G-protein coupled receptor B0563.6 n=1 Tax=Littorina saxatilis TaxID=31220 RepID=UPI0038B47A75